MGSRSVRRGLFGMVLIAVLLLGAFGGAGTYAKGGQQKGGLVKHFFVIVLENENADTTFGPGSPAPYLSQILRSRGAFLPNYFGIGHNSLDNYLAMISGQAPNQQTQADCPVFTDFGPGTPAPGGQVVGQGCVYPSWVPTVANLLQKRKLGWRGYMEDMANGPGQPTTCRHPAIGAPDPTLSLTAGQAGDQYATRHDPFVYFHSVIDSPICSRNVVDYSRLAGDLKSEKKTPSYSFITPNVCHDGHDHPCVDGQPGGLVSANQWLSENVPPILRSKAYKDHGLLLITFDEADSSPPDGDASACCGELPGPNTTSPGFFGPGGGRIGAVALSPCIKRGTVDGTPYNHYSMLLSVEKFFQLKHLGFSAQAGLSSFGKRTFTARKRCSR